MSLHTPGPWNAHKSGNGAPSWAVTIETGELIVGGYNLRDQEANARLIAAAPELLAVCEELAVCAAYWSEYDVPLGIADRMTAAIDKAKGGAA